MFYCCKACEAGCSGCAKACEESCKLCCDICTKPCDLCCTALCTVLDQPLGGYVFLTYALNIPAAVCAAISLTEPQVMRCSEAPLMAFCIANLLLAVTHMAFASYLQHRLVVGLQSELHSTGRTATTQLTSKELLSRAGNIVLYDVGFCLYLFIFFGGSFGVNIAGLVWAGVCHPNTALPWLAAGLMLFYNSLVVHFAFLWVCSLACYDCCKGFFTKRTTSAGRVENQGLGRLFFGKTGAIVPAPARAAAGAAASSGAAAEYAYPAPSAPTASELARGQQAPTMQAMRDSAPPAGGANAEAGRPTLLTSVPAVDGIVIGAKH